MEAVSHPPRGPADEDDQQNLEDADNQPHRKTGEDRQHKPSHAGGHVQANVRETVVRILTRMIPDDSLDEIILEMDNVEDGDAILIPTEMNEGSLGETNIIPDDSIDSILRAHHSANVEEYTTNTDEASEVNQDENVEGGGNPDGDENLFPDDSFDADIRREMDDPIPDD